LAAQVVVLIFMLINWLAADCLTTLFRNTLNWKLESLNICLRVHLFLILLCCCLSVTF